MSKKLEVVEVKLPLVLMVELTAIASLAGVSIETVIKVALATEQRRHMPMEQTP